MGVTDLEQSSAQTGAEAAHSTEARAAVQPRARRPEPTQVRAKIAFGEIIAFAADTFCSNKIRFILTALGMVIGTASLILVVTIGMTGKQYVLNQIQSIGTNEVWAEYLGGAPHISNSNPDPMTIEDLQAVQQTVPGIVAAS